MKKTITVERNSTLHLHLIDMVQKFGSKLKFRFDGRYYRILDMTHGKNNGEFVVHMELWD